MGTDKVAIVTGAGRGIGRAVALKLAEHNFHLMLAARTSHQLDETLGMVRGHKVEAVAAPTDVSEPAEVQALVDATMEAYGRVDLLANVAGNAIYREDIEQFTPKEFDATFDVNVKGIFLTTRTVWPIMKQQAEGGVIVNVSSMAAKDPFPGFAVYGASKAAVNLFTESVAKAGREHNIRLFAVCPGAVDTPLLRKTFPEFPANECLSADEVADVVAWCFSETAANCSGQALWVTPRCQ